MTVVAAMVCLLMTGLMAATLITEGAVIDEPTAGGEIWVALVGFTALTVLVSALAVARIRRLRRRSS